MTTKIAIDPITRLEGHGKIEIFLDDDGAVEDMFFQIPELRGFERFVVGRPIEELPRIVTRICGVCPASHHMASAKAWTAASAASARRWPHKLREMYYQAHFIHSHIAHFYALAAPDFVLGPDADPATRNVLGVVHKVGLEVGGAVIASRAKAQEIQRVIGGRNTQDIWASPGASPRASSRRSSSRSAAGCGELYDFTQFSLQLFRDVVLANPTYVDIIANGPYTLDVHNMGLVDENNAPNFYDGQVRVVDFDGHEICRYAAARLCRLRRRARRAVDLPEVPLPQAARLEGVRGGQDIESSTAPRRWRGSTWPSDGHAEARRRRSRRCSRRSARTRRTRLARPTTGRASSRWCRTPRRCAASATIPAITRRRFRVIPQQITGEGVGIVEAMRGTLTHHYSCDENGICTSANLIVGTTNNNARHPDVDKKVARHA